MWYALTVCAVIFLAFLGAVYLADPRKPGERYRDNTSGEIATAEGRSYRSYMIAAGVVTVVLYLVLSFFFTWKTVDAGNVGLVKRFGAYTTVKAAGATFIWPWESITEAKIRNASHEVRMDGGENGSAASKESQEVFVVATVNYSLNQGCVQRLYTNYGDAYFETIIEPRVRQIFKAETVRFSAIEILPNREQIRKDTQEVLNTQLNASTLFGEGCVTGLDFLLTNVGFGESFTKAIEEKATATQQAAAEQNRVTIAENIAKQAVATAEGEARANVARARGDAQANRLRQRSLTPGLIQLAAIEKLNPKVSVIVCPPRTVCVPNAVVPVP